MVPSSVAKRNLDAHPCTWNSFDPFHTTPVGEPGPFSPAVGINTFKACCSFPWPSYKVDQPELLSATHQGEPAAWTNPQALTSNGSSLRACLTWFEDRFVSLYCAMAALETNIRANTSVCGSIMRRCMGNL